jgi:hypothetical protein
MITFRAEGKEYCGSSALEIVGCLSEEEASLLEKQLSIREFMLWSLAELSGGCIRMREVDVGGRMDDEKLALGYLYLREGYGAGELSGAPLGKRSREQDLRLSGHKSPASITPARSHFQ